MPRDYRLQLDDILAAIAQIREYVGEMTYEAFAADKRTQDAVIRNLLIIGEAARAIPDAIKSQAKDIEWRRIVGLRNLLIHEYFGISLPLVWDVLVNKLDALARACGELKRG